MPLVWKSKQTVTPRDEAEMAQILRALGHPKRLHILRLLLDRGSCLCGELVPELSLAQSTVSQHLNILKRAGVLEGEPQGARNRYRLQAQTLRDLEAYLTDLKIDRQLTINRGE